MLPDLEYVKWLTNMNELNSAQVRWGCRRGMLECDLFLLPFFDAEYEKLTQREKENFCELLKETDPELFAWFMGQAVPAKKELIALVKKIRTFRGYS